MAHELKEGQEVKLSVPFVYTIGEEGPVTGKLLKTIEDCKDEVRAEIEQGFDDVFIEVVE